jgi:hypothetical protein
MVILTDSQIDNLIADDKYLQDSVLRNTKWKISGAHRKKDVLVTDSQGNEIFMIFWRQLVTDSLDFTVGLSYKVPDSTQRINLIRCNGKSHIHTNKIESDNLDITYHLHKASERYQVAGFKPEDHAVATDKYSTMDEAFKYLCTIANIHIGDKRQTRLEHG